MIVMTLPESPLVSNAVILQVPVACMTQKKVADHPAGIPTGCLLCIRTTTPSCHFSERPLNSGSRAVLSFTQSSHDSGSWENVSLCCHMTQNKVWEQPAQIPTGVHCALGLQLPDATTHRDRTTGSRVDLRLHCHMYDSEKMCGHPARTPTGVHCTLRLQCSPGATSRSPRTTVVHGHILACAVA